MVFGRTLIITARTQAFSLATNCGTAVGLAGFFVTYYFNDSGVVAANLWNSKNDHLHEIRQIMAQIFSNNILNLPVPDRGNIIIFTTRNKSTL